jgi:hypothetical protein
MAFPRVGAVVVAVVLLQLVTWAQSLYFISDIYNFQMRGVSWYQDAYAGYARDGKCMIQSSDDPSAGRVHVGEYADQIKAISAAQTTVTSAINTFGSSNQGTGAGTGRCGIYGISMWIELGRTFWLDVSRARAAARPPPL